MSYEHNANAIKKKNDYSKQKKNPNIYEKKLVIHTICGDHLDRLIL